METSAWFKNERFRGPLSKPPFQSRNRYRYRNRLSSIRTMVAPKSFLDPDFDSDFDPDTLILAVKVIGNQQSVFGLARTTDYFTRRVAMGTESCHIDDEPVLLTIALWAFFPELDGEIPWDYNGFHWNRMSVIGVLDDKDLLDIES